jgi:hypothetical protein
MTGNQVSRHTSPVTFLDANPRKPMVATVPPSFTPRLAAMAIQPAKTLQGPALTTEIG